MSAKAILKRYLERNSSALPENPAELRQKVTAVAAGARLVLTPDELDELAPLPPKQKGAKSGDSEGDAKKGGNATTEEV